MRRPAVIAAVVIAAIAVAAAVFALLRDDPHDPARSAGPVTADLPVRIGERTVTLVDGVARSPAAPGSAATETVRAVGDPVLGDIDGDGDADAALVLSDDAGGSGTFFYAVVAVQDGSGWRATNALPLGDRITPEDIRFADGTFVYRYLERPPGAAMADAPTVEKTLTVRFDPASGRIAAAP